MMLAPVRHEGAEGQTGRAGGVAVPARTNKHTTHAYLWIWRGNRTSRPPDTPPHGWLVISFSLTHVSYFALLLGGAVLMQWMLADFFLIYTSKYEPKTESGTPQDFSEGVRRCRAQHLGGYFPTRRSKQCGTNVWHEMLKPKMLWPRYPGFAAANLWCHPSTNGPRRVPREVCCCKLKTHSKCDLNISWSTCVPYCCTVPR